MRPEELIGPQEAAHPKANSYLLRNQNDVAVIR